MLGVEVLKLKGVGRPKGVAFSYGPSGVRQDQTGFGGLGLECRLKA